jgi:hypothetical protein
MTLDIKPKIHSIFRCTQHQTTGDHFKTVTQHKHKMVTIGPKRKTCLKTVLSANHCIVAFNYRIILTNKI